MAHQAAAAPALSNGSSPGMMPSGSSTAPVHAERDPIAAARARFVTVGSDARLRCCVVAEHDGSRLWADYDVSTAPNDLPRRVILDALSAFIKRLEQSVTRLEAMQLEKEIQRETDIAAAKARLSGISDEGVMPRRHAESETEKPHLTDVRRRHADGVAPTFRRRR